MRVRIAHTFSEMIAGFEKLCVDFTLLLTRGTREVADCTEERMLYSIFQHRACEQCGQRTSRQNIFLRF
jgi:hypothetical protein